MVSSTIKKTISLAISLLVVVISLTGVALGAGAPTVSTLTRYIPGFAGAPGKMARDVAGNFYVADFWGKGIVKLDRNGSKIGFIPTNGRPAAVAALPDSRLVVAMAAPQRYVAFYKQLGTAPNGSGEEAGVFTGSLPYRPTGIVAVGNYIYVLDAGDATDDAVINVPKIRVYSTAGVDTTYAIGARTNGNVSATVLDARLKQPAGIAYERIGDKIVVADTLNGRLLFFTPYNGTSMTPSSFIGATAGLTPPSVNSNPVTFGNPVDVAFQYDDTSLQRIYVAERGRDEVSVLDATTSRSTKYINGTLVTNASMKLPSSLLFERTGTGTSIDGLLYVSSAATATAAANILALGIDRAAFPAPAVAITMAAIPATSASPLAVSGTTSPANAVACKVNGGADVVATGTGAWNASLTLQPDAMNYIVCRSTIGGYTAYAEASTYSGTPASAPTVGITQPVAGLYTSNTSVTVTGTTNPGNATVQVVNSLGGTTSTQSDASGNWSTVVTLAEGSNLLTATATKPGTSTSTPATRTVVADFTPPSMTLSFLANNKTTTTAVQNLDGIVVDANLAKVEVNGVEVLAGAKVTLAPATNTYFSTPVVLERGANTVTIKATDLAGLSTTVTRTPITLNPELPGFTVALPADNSYRTATGAVTASGTANAAFNSVNAAGTAVTPSAGNWTTAAMSTLSGFNYYEFSASGPGATTVSEKRTINTGATYAQAAITSPAADIATNTASVTVAGNIPSANPTPQISINGAAFTSVSTYAGGNFSHNVPLVQGLNTVKIFTSNGTTATAVRNIVYDTAPPELIIQADSKPMPTFISGSLEPSAKMTSINATLDGAPVAIPLSRTSFEPYDQSGAVIWKADLSGYAYDAIGFSAVDPAGNTATLAYKAGIPTGDVDGDGVVRLADALATLRHTAGTQLITDPDEYFAGDVGGLINGRTARDGVIDISDSYLILNKAYGLMTF